MRQALAAQAKQRGLSFIYPMFDVDDLALVSAAQLWAGDWSGLTVAATRYQPDLVLNLLIESSGGCHWSSWLTPYSATNGGWCLSATRVQWHGLE